MHAKVEGQEEEAHAPVKTFRLLGSHKIGLRWSQEFHDQSLPRKMSQDLEFQSVTGCKGFTFVNIQNNRFPVCGNASLLTSSWILEKSFLSEMLFQIKILLDRERKCINFIRFNSSPDSCAVPLSSIQVLESKIYLQTLSVVLTTSVTDINPSGLSGPWPASQHTLMTSCRPAAGSCRALICYHCYEFWLPITVFWS